MWLQIKSLNFMPRDQEGFSRIITIHLFSRFEYVEYPTTRSCIMVGLWKKYQKFVMTKKLINENIILNIIILKCHQNHRNTNEAKGPLKFMFSLSLPCSAIITLTNLSPGGCPCTLQKKKVNKKSWGSAEGLKAARRLEHVTETKPRATKWNRKQLYMNDSHSPS